MRPEDSQDMLLRTLATSTEAVSRMGAEAGSTSPVVDQMADSLIMMIDDDPIDIAVLRALLHNAGYTNFVATMNPLQAVDLIATRRPDILLLDIVMPQMSGLEVLKRLRSTESQRHLPVIFLTSSTDSDTKLMALELGATDFLGKPVDSSELALRIRNTLSAKAYHDRLANYDAVTGLPNRGQMMGRIEQALHEATNTGAIGAVLQINLDRFKQVNEVLGLDAGDSVLKAVAMRLDLALRSSAAAIPNAPKACQLILARVGGDEFTVLVNNIGEARNASQIAENLVEAMRGPLHAAGREVFLNVSIGVAVFPRNGIEVGTLVNNADVAMRCAKQQGGNGYQLFSQEQNARSIHRFSLESGLRRAIDRDELRLFYQPKVRVNDGRGSGAEVLVRWQHPERGLLGPSEFIPLAEEVGLVVPLGEWVLRTASAQSAVWLRAGLRVPRVSVNVAAPQFCTQRFPQTVRLALEDADLDPIYLGLELTESAMMEDAPRSVRALAELKDIGLRLSIDDFGTGYSSLSYLKRFPLDELKIDRSFVTGVDIDANNAAIVIATIAMARGLGLSVCAEGVETKSQLALLQRHDCDECQGYYFSKPMSADAFAKLLSNSAGSAIAESPIASHT